MKSASDFQFLMCTTYAEGLRVEISFEARKRSCFKRITQIGCGRSLLQAFRRDAVSTIVMETKARKRRWQVVTSITTPTRLFDLTLLKQISRTRLIFSSIWSGSKKCWFPVTKDI